MVSVATRVFGVTLGRLKVFPINDLKNIHIESYEVGARSGTVTRYAVVADQNLVILNQLKAQQAPVIADAIRKLVDANMGN